MSVVDQLVPGAARRLLVRALVVVGGVVAVTAVGWLLSTSSAHADELPAVPLVPSVLSAVPQPIQHPAAPRLSTPDVKDIKAPELKPVVERLLPTPPSLDTVTRHVPVAVDDPAVPPLTKPARQDTESGSPVVQHAITVAVRPHTTRQVPAPKVTHVTSPAPAPVSWHATSAPSQHHQPLLPPVQPAGSPDSTVHGGTGVAGGPGGACAPFTPVLGAGPALADPSSSPRLAVAPGTQPGTSPD